MSAERIEKKNLEVIGSHDLPAGESGAWITAIKRTQAVIEFSPDGSILNANENFLKASGYGLDEIQGKHHRVFCDPEYAQSSEYKEFWKKLGAGDPHSGEYKRLGKNGQAFWIMASYNPILGADGKIEKVVKFATDITDAKAELQVRMDIMDATSLISQTNLKGEILSVNEKFLEYAKYSEKELIGSPHNIVRHPDMPKEVFKEVWATIGRGKMFRGIIKNRAKDGTPYYVDAVIAPVMGRNGKPSRYIGVRYDITAMELERQQMRGLFQAVDSSFAYIEFDMTGTVVSCNKNFQSAMEYSEEAVKGKHHRIFCDATEASSPEYMKFWDELKAGRPQSGVFKRKTQSGKTIYLQAVYSPVKNEVGEVSKVIKVASDVTQQQLIDIKLQEAANTLASTAEELTATASEMLNTANSTTKESQATAAAAVQVATGIQSVATNMEEMVASIKEIGRSTNESAQMAKTTMAKAQESNQIVTKLGDSSQEIGEVIKVISSIAQQTNLLALNAQIEAARAGEAGKGFAVVANEVKELAKQTAKATDDITNKIGAIQTDTKNAVEAIGGISKAVENLNGLSSVVAAAVEEQTATTNEISRVVIESKTGVDSIVAAIKTVSEAANTTSANSSQTVDATKGLSKLAEGLLALVKRAK